MLRSLVALLLAPVLLPVPLPGVAALSPSQRQALALEHPQCFLHAISPTGTEDRTSEAHPGENWAILSARRSETWPKSTSRAPRPMPRSRT